MTKGAGIRLPKVPTHQALYAKKIDVKAMKKIDQIKEELDVSKHLVINSIICTALGIDSKNRLNLKKWLKGF